MKRIVLFAIALTFLSCGSIQPVASNNSDPAKKQILPPDTPSNKYSKTRQGGR